MREISHRSGGKSGKPLSQWIFESTRKRPLTGSRQLRRLNLFVLRTIWHDGRCLMQFSQFALTLRQPVVRLLASLFRLSVTRILGLVWQHDPRF
jgi:hypothetical protein